MTNTYRVLLRFEVWLLILTVLYSGLLAIGLGYQDDTAACYDTCPAGFVRNEHLGLPVVNFLGLFVPVGPNNFIVAIPALIVIIISLFFIEKSIREFGLSPFYKILLNLIILFLITLCVDMATLGKWKSYEIFQKSVQSSIWSSS